MKNVEETLKKKLEFCSISAGIILPGEQRRLLFDSSSDHIKPLLRVVVKKPSSKTEVVPNVFKTGLQGPKDTKLSENSPDGHTPNMTDDTISENNGETGTISRIDLTYVTNNDFTEVAMTPVLGDHIDNDQSHEDLSPKSSK